jgi:hypothetical protein
MTPRSIQLVKIVSYLFLGVFASWRFLSPANLPDQGDFQHRFLSYRAWDAELIHGDGIIGMKAGRAIAFETLESRTLMTAAPTHLAARATSASQISLSWSDNSADEQYFILERSPNGKTFTRIASPAVNVTRYTDSGLAPGRAYEYRIKALGETSGSQWAQVIVKTQPVVSATTLGSLSQAAVNAAIAAPLIRFNRDIPGGAYTNGAWNGGASIALALASYTGNTSADARLLEQIRYSITGGNEICANGGYPSQHERQVTGMFELAKLTPRILDQLSGTEQRKIDLIMEAAMVASAFTTSDSNPYITSHQQQRTLDADTNVGRDWNPNFREGMVGAMLVGAAYFGPAQAEKVLDNYDHQTFVSELKAAGLSNLYQTFNWKVANPNSIAPDGTTIEQGVRNYRYYGSPLTDLMGIYDRLMLNTYGGTVNSGLNNGAGINGAGKMVSGAATLPNQGKVGMLTEFDGSDGAGPRSAAYYAYDGFRPNQTDLLVLIASGNWQKTSAIAHDTERRLEVGNTDLFYKLDKGYVSYANGGGQMTLSTAADSVDWGFVYNRAIWEQVVQPYLSAQ